MSAVQVAIPEFLAAEEFSIFRSSAAKFFEQHATDEDLHRWRSQGIVDRSLWTKAGAAGMLGLSVPEAFGGAGGDFRHEIVMLEELGRRGADHFGIALHNCIVTPYILKYGSETQKRAWLPGIVTGELVTAIAMTEPGTGSDLQKIRTVARRDGNGYIISGQKTFITNGQTANLICVAAKTDPTLGARGISLLMVDTDHVSGFARGRNLEKLGMEGQDTSELFFNDVRVPADNLLGMAEGQGFAQMMEMLPQERLVIAWQCVAMMERALNLTSAYVKERTAFGQHVADFQNTQFKLAECRTHATIARVFAYYCSDLLLRGKLDSATASMAKYWISDRLCTIIDECLQLHGGYGYMAEFAISQMYKDARVQRIYGGTNEIMKMLISRSN